MPFWGYYSEGFNYQFAWFMTWIIKGFGLYLILWALGLAKTTIIESTITDFDDGGSPVAKSTQIEADFLMKKIHELRRVA